MRFALILSLLIASCADETISGYADRNANYRLTEIDGVAFEPLATISFPEEGSVVGNAPCNTWSAAQKAPYPWIELGPIAVTRRACPELEMEQQFFSSLGGVSLAEVTGSVLILSGETTMVFEAER